MTLPIPIRVLVLDDSAFARKVIRAVLEESADFLVVGTSTGGPQALSVLLSSLPAEFPSAIAIVLHIPPGYTEPLAERMDRDSALKVLEAEDGLELRLGRAVIAKAGFHLKVIRRAGVLQCGLDLLPFQTAHRPSVDMLFESAAAVLGGEVLGPVMTGMGEDGLAGTRPLLAAGARMPTQDEASCVVYGMPRSIFAAGLSNRVAPLDGIPGALREMLGRP